MGLRSRKARTRLPPEAELISEIGREVTVRPVQMCSSGGERSSSELTWRDTRCHSATKIAATPSPLAPLKRLSLTRLCNRAAGSRMCHPCPNLSPPARFRRPPRSFTGCRPLPWDPRRPPDPQAVPRCRALRSLPVRRRTAEPPCGVERLHAEGCRGATDPCPGTRQHPSFTVVVGGRRFSRACCSSHALPRLLLSPRLCFATQPHDRSWQHRSVCGKARARLPKGPLRIEISLQSALHGAISGCVRAESLIPSAVLGPCSACILAFEPCSPPLQAAQVRSELDRLWAQGLGRPGFLPTRSEFVAAGERSLYDALTSMGGLDALARSVGIARPQNGLGRVSEELIGYLKVRQMVLLVCDLS